MEASVELLALPFLLCLAMTAILSYLGIHVLKREVVFIDIALAQMAALGAIVAHSIPGAGHESVASYACAFGAVLVAAGFYALARRRVAEISLEVVIGVSYAIGAAGVAFWLLRRPFARISDDYEEAARAGMRTAWWDFLFYALLGLVITVAIRVGGVVVVFAFLIIPSTVAALFASGWGRRLVLAWAAGATGSAGGLLVGALIPMLARGCSPLLATGAFCAVSLLGIFAMAGGVDLKALAAGAGSVVGLGAAAGLLLGAARLLGFSGTESVPARFLAWVGARAGVGYDYVGLVTASLLVATLGLVMDMAVTVAAGVAQVRVARPGASRAEAFAAGMNISRDVVGTMVLTLLFAFVGMRLPVLLLPPALGLSPAELVNSEAGSVEILYALVGSFALAATGPATALAAALLATRRPPRGKTPGRGRRLLACALALAATGCVVGGGATWWRLRGERLELPRTVDALLRAARGARRQGRVGEALMELWAASRRDPTDPRVHAELAYISMARRWLAHAREEIEKALAFGADDSFAHYVAGVVYIWTGQKTDATHHLMRALELDPYNAAARQALRNLLLQ